MSETFQRYTLAIVAHLALLLAWYLFVTLGKVPQFVMPSPGATLDALLQPNYSWWTNVAVTATEIFAGYFLALAVGVALAAVFTWSKMLDEFSSVASFVGQQNPAEAGWECVEPMDAMQQVWRLAPECFRLACLQFSAEFEDEVMRRKAVQ